MRALLVCLCLAVSWGPATGTETLSVEDTINGVGFRDLAFSADGRWLAWTVSRADTSADRAVGDLYRLDLRDPAAVPRRLTVGSSDDRSPVFSPDAASIAFLSTRGEKAKPQVWRIAPDGGEAEALTDWSAGVESFTWAGDGRILFTAEEGETQRERRLEKAKDDAQVVEDVEHWKAVRLFALDPATKKVRRLTENDDRIEGFWARRDGRAVVTRHVVSIHQVSQVGGPRPHYFLHDLDAGTTTRIFEEEIFDPSRVEFSHDGRRLYAEWDYSRLHSDQLRSAASIHTLWSVDLSTMQRIRVAFDAPMGLTDAAIGPSWRVVRGGVVALVADRTHVRPMRMIEGKEGGWHVVDLEGEGRRNWFALATDAIGDRIAVVHSRASEPPSLRVGALKDARVRDLRTVHDPSAAMRSKLGRSEPITWTSSKDGAEITGILHYPHGYDARQARRWPLMLVIHGGPSGVDTDSFENYWSAFPHLLASRGMFVLQPNYRGSSNHGIDVVEAIAGGAYYSYEIPDIMSGVDALVGRGLVHADSLGTMGWSNGAILTIRLTVEHPERFRVASAGAGDVNWTSDFGNCAFGPNFDVTYFGTTPWDDPERYVSLSPLFRLPDVTTPTLIQFGEKDTSVPTEQGWQHYRALQLLDRAAVRFLLYPGTGHGLTRLSHQRRKVEEDLAWIDRHLFGRVPARNEAIEPGSALDLALHRARWPRSEDALGERRDDLLLPLVDARPLASTMPVRMGRTEITRAQFAAFLRDAAGATHAAAIVGWDPAARSFAAGTEDLPVTGVDFDAAQDYARWLSARTGTTWRLPTTAEWDAAAAGVATEKENTLCWWAGHSLTFDEADALRVDVVNGPGATSLLRPVASTGASSTARCFDLQGNATEWTTESGRGVLRGRCALDDCSSIESDPSSAPPTLRGLRLVRVDG